MNIKYFLWILFLLFFGCKKENSSNTNNKIVQLPNNLIILKPCDNLINDLKILFPELKNIFLRDTVYFADTIQKNIVLIKESYVYVSFVNEGASYKNTLCWYSYNISKPPLRVSDINRILLFPNISKSGPGGGLLEPGYTLQLGKDKIPAGTIIGFALVMNGWNKGIIDYNGIIHYTNYEFNNGGKQQHILLKDANCGDIILSYEDMAIADTACDKDYNDVVISISDNKDGFAATSFDLSKVVIK